MLLHGLDGDEFSNEPVDGDVHHTDQQVGSRKTRVLAGPKDELEQSHIDKAMQMASENASTSATSLIPQQNSSLSSTAPASAPATAPAATPPDGSPPDDGFTLVKGKGKKGQPKAGASRRSAPYAGKQSSS